MPLVVTRQFILLKTLPWYERPAEIKRPEYPQLLTYQQTLPNLGEIEQALRVMPSPYGDWPIRADLVPDTITVLLRPPYRATDAALDHLSRGEVQAVKRWLLAKGLGYETAKTVEVLPGGRHALARVLALPHR
jgi:hypothetical protein